MSSEEGFLSPEMASTVERIRQEYSAWFALIGAANRLAMDVLPELKPDVSDNQKILEAAFFSKALQSAQAVVLLLERGMIGDARTVLRSCVETALLQRKIADDKSFEARLLEWNDHHRRTLANSVLEEARLTSQWPAEHLESIRAATLEIESKYPGGKPRGVHLAEIAASVNGMHLYTLFFRPMSGDSAHGTLDSLARHVTSDKHGDMTGFAFGPQSRNVPETLSACLSVLFHVLDTAIEGFGLAQYRTRLADCLANWKALGAPK